MGLVEGEGWDQEINDWWHFSIEERIIFVMIMIRDFFCPILYFFLIIFAVAVF